MTQHAGGSHLAVYNAEETAQHSLEWGDRNSTVPSGSLASMAWEVVAGWVKQAPDSSRAAAGEGITPWSSRIGRPVSSLDNPQHLFLDDISLLEAIRDKVRMRQVNREQAAAWGPVEEQDLIPLTKNEYQAYARCLNRERMA